MVDMANRPGELARLCDMVAARGVNLVLCGLAHGDRRSVAFIADDDNAARAALRSSKLDYVERRAVTVRLQNIPGVAGRLPHPSRGGRKRRGLPPVRIFDDEFYAVICPDNVSAALAALGDQVVTS